MSNSMISDYRSLTGKNGYYDNVPTFEQRSTLGKDSFLRLLVEQLKNQDPLEPLQDREFIAQMTQFSSLEQITNMAASMNRFVEYQMTGMLGQQAYLIDQMIYWEMKGEGGSLKGEGIVKAVSLKDGDIIVELNTGAKISTKDIYRIEKVNQQPPAQPNLKPEEPPTAPDIDDTEIDLVEDNPPAEPEENSSDDSQPEETESVDNGSSEGTAEEVEDHEGN